MYFFIGIAEPFSYVKRCGSKPRSVKLSDKIFHAAFPAYKGEAFFVSPDKACNVKASAVQTYAGNIII